MWTLTRAGAPASAASRRRRLQGAARGGRRERISADPCGGDAGNTDDSEALQTVVAGHVASVGDKPDEVVTDSKYASGDNRAYLAQEEITGSDGGAARWQQLQVPDHGFPAVELMRPASR